ncbi:MAG: Ribosomal-protein-L7p-serine acetyltransferase [Verrucomicrobiales bacterium]|nr:Ribosomal-protein-L7p-serine acetyltransferase [Verrucomicrobiales bacterium]
MISLPPALITTPRLIIRRRDPSDAALFKDAVDSSLEHLRQWMPWAHDEPIPLEALRERIAGFALNFEEGREFVYGILSKDGSEALGCLGLHLRNEDTDREIGYWLRVSATGQGFITEAAAAVTTAAFATWPDVQTVTIVCDPANARSAAVPARLGYSCLGNRPSKEPTPARSEDQVWRITREGWHSSTGNGRAAVSQIQP